MEAPSRLADWWCSLYTLFLSSKGLKLRITIPDTFIIRNGQLTAWFQTSDEGYVHRLSPQKLTPESVYKTLLRKEVSDPNLNPHRYVAIAHFSRHASRLLRREELDILLGEVDPPGTPPRALMDNATPSKDLPYCVQGFVPPIVDMRYVTTYTMEDGASCTTFARRFSSRYTHAHNDAGSASFEEDAPELSPSHGPYRSAGSGRPVSAMVPSRTGAMSPQPMRPHSSAGLSPMSEVGAYLDVDAAAQMQLNAQQDFDSEVQRRQASGNGENWEDGSPDGNGGGEGFRPVRLEVDHKARADIRRLVQAIVSFIERAHGLRLVGMVAETTRCCDGSLLLLAVHATQWDMRHTRGSMATYTERMNDYRSGLVAPPASQPANRSPTYSSRRTPKASSPPLPHLGLRELGDRQGVHDRPWTTGAPVYHQGRPDIQPLEVPGTPDSPYGSRFGTPASNSRLPSRSAYSTRSASPLYGGSRAHGGIRAGAGGSPSGREISPSPKTRTWTPRTADAAGHVQGDGLNRDVVAGLADDLEATKECLQMQYDAAARAEAALAQLQSEHAAAMEAYQQTTASLELSLVDTQRERDMLNDSANRLTEQNRELEEGLAKARAEAEELRASLTSERDTNAVNQRAQNQRDAELRAENERIREELNAMREERLSMKDALSQEQEVVAAVRTQLVEYKLYIQQLEERNGAIKNAGARIGANKGTFDIGSKLEKKTEGATRPPVYSPRGSPEQSKTGYVSRMSPRPALSKASSIADEASRDMFSPRNVGGGQRPGRGGSIAHDYTAEVQLYDMGGYNTRWMDINISDLVAVDGHQLKGVHERHAAVIRVLQVAETDLHDIFTFYAHLGRLVMRGKRVTLGLHQFMKFAKDTGCVDNPEDHSPQGFIMSTAQAEVVFTQVANSEIRVTCEGDHRFYFEGFLETLIRLACIKYGWSARSASKEAASPGWAAPKGGGDLPFASPRTQKLAQAKAASAKSTTAPAKPEEAKETENTTDLVTTLKIFLYNDVLPKARRNKLAGSAHARKKADTMAEQAAKQAI